MHIYQPLLSGWIWHKVIFKRSLTGFNSEFFSKTSWLTKAEEPSLPYYLPIAGRIIGFIPFPRVLVLCEMLSVSSRIWTRVAVYISNDDNDYTTGTSGHFLGYVWPLSVVLLANGSYMYIYIKIYIHIYMYLIPWNGPLGIMEFFTKRVAV